MRDRYARRVAQGLRCPVEFALLTLVLGFAVLEAAHPPAARAQDQTPPPAAQPTAPAAKADVKTIQIILARELIDHPPPLSLLDIPPLDDGIAGAKLAILDNNTTGRFVGQDFKLEVVENPKSADLVAEIEKRVAAGAGFIVADVSPKTLLALSDAVKSKDVVIFNAGATDDRLREEDCRTNVKHTAPTRSMLADGLTQYMAWKQWRRLLMVVGPQPEDEAYAEAFRRSAKRFGLKIVEERKFVYEAGSRRSDGGHEQVQQQIPTFMQNAPEHDVVVVADESGLFGEYFPYRTWVPRPVIGTAGLTAVSWHPALEQWGGTQFQNRFKRLANRNMRARDYDVWVAVRSIGEAATRKKSVVPKDLIEYMRSAEFELAAFKGQKLTYRSWNGQLRQPMLITTARLLVSVSPQPGFLHEFSVLDTLGIDKPETKCKAYVN